MKSNKTLILVGFLFLLVVLGVAFYILQNKSEHTENTEQTNTGSQNNVAFNIPKLKDVSVKSADGSTLDYKLAEGLHLAIASEGMKRIRFMAFSPDERLFLTDMKDLSDNSDGKIYILSGFDGLSKKFTSRTTYLENLRNPNDVKFFKDKSGTNWIYIALTDKIIRYKFNNGDLKPSGEPQTIATFPDYGLSYKYGGWHLTRSLQFINDKLYVSVGSSCNSCEEKEGEIRAEIVVMDPDGKNLRTYADGLRNAVGMTSKDGNLYVTNMGVDHLGENKGDDTFFKIQDGKHYGWPYCNHIDGVAVADETKIWRKPAPSCSQIPNADAYFIPHSAPLGVAYVGNEIAPIKNSFVVALHGSGVVDLKHGYSVVGIHDGQVYDIMTGFLVGNTTTRQGRPAGVLNAYERFGGIFVSDDNNGKLYFIY